MIRSSCRWFGFLSLMLVLAACEPQQTPQEGSPEALQEAPQEEIPFEPEYKSIETRLLDDDLVAFDLVMTGARDPEDVRRFGDCAAAQYALIRGYGYARHLRTTTQRSGELWRGNGIYTISAERPDGLEIIEAEETVATCQDEEIPTV